MKSKESLEKAWMFRHAVGLDLEYQHPKFRPSGWKQTFGTAGRGNREFTGFHTSCYHNFHHRQCSPFRYYYSGFAQSSLLLRLPRTPLSQLFTNMTNEPPNATLPRDSKRSTR